MDKPDFATNVFHPEVVPDQSIEEKIYWMKVSVELFLVGVLILLLLLDMPIPDRFHEFFNNVVCIPFLS